MRLAGETFNEFSRCTLYRTSSKCLSHDSGVASRHNSKLDRHFATQIRVGTKSGLEVIEVLASVSRLLEYSLKLVPPSPRYTAGSRMHRNEFFNTPLRLINLSRPHD
jgi:hypothetical protein